jgi:hypothetical protein
MSGIKVGFLLTDLTEFVVNTGKDNQVPPGADGRIWLDMESHQTVLVRDSLQTEGPRVLLQLEKAVNTKMEA